MKNIQATGNLYGETITIKQVSKAKAKKVFAKGETVYLQSSNMYPFGVWQNVCPIKLDTEQLKASIDHNNFCINLYSEQINECNTSNEAWRKNMLSDYEEKLNTHKSNVINEASQFEYIVNEYSYYNCDNERGRYIHFYVKS